MPVNSGPVGSTAPSARAPISLRALQLQIAQLRSLIGYQQKNRTPPPTSMSDLANGGPMAGVQDGHSPVYKFDTGLYRPAPVFAELVFSAAGAFTASTSPPLHARYGCSITGIAADLGTFSDAVEFEVLVNGTVAYTVNMTSAATGLILVTPTPLAAYTDLVSITVTSIGSGNEDLVVHVETDGNN